MPLTILDPKTALLLIDLQRGIVGMAPADAIAPVLQHAGQLAAAFRQHGLPVVLVNVAGGAPGRTDQPRRSGTPPADWLEFVDALDQQPQDHVVTKKTWGAFTATGLHEYLQGLGVTQVVLAGVSTSIGVESTARQASELGYNVGLATDAMIDLDPASHAHSLKTIFPRLGESGSTADVLRLVGESRSA